MQVKIKYNMKETYTLHMCCILSNSIKKFKSFYLIPILKNCLVNHDIFKRHVLCFELKTVEKYDNLWRGFSKRLETKAAWKTVKKDGRMNIRNFI